MTTCCAYDDVLQKPWDFGGRFSRLTTFPTEFVVLGDAISSFNPVYGQGMSSAALQVKAFQQIVCAQACRAQGLAGLAPSFFTRAAAILVTPWTLAATQDWAYPPTQGGRPVDLAKDTPYFAALEALSVNNVAVHRLMVDVFNLIKPLSALHEEPWRSWVCAQQRHQGTVLGG